MITRYLNSSDLEAVSAIRLRTRQTSYRGIIDDVYLDSLSIKHYREKVKHMCTLSQNGEAHGLIAEGDDGTVLGFLIGVVSSKNVSDVSHEIYALYVDPDCQWQGVGKALFSAFVERVTQENGTGFFARTAKENMPTRAFYEKRGGVAMEESAVTLGEKDYPIVCYTWKMSDAV